MGSLRRFAILGLLVLVANLALAVASSASCRNVLEQSLWPAYKAWRARFVERNTLFQQLFFAPAPSAKLPKVTRTQLERVGGFLKGTASFGIRNIAHLLSPIDVPLLSQPKSYALFKKLETDPAWRKYVLENDDWWWKLSPTEMEASTGIERFSTFYRRRAQYLNDYPLTFKGAKGLGYGMTGLRYGAYASGIALVILEMEYGLVEPEKLLDDPKEALRDDQIQLIDETLPFPHLAIRIGNNVYSYGQSQMTITPARIYLDAILGQQLAGEEASWMSKNRAVHVATLNLSKDEVLNLKRHLELQNGKLYRNMTLVNDCSSMVVRAIEATTKLRIGSAIDASPTAVLESFAYRKMAGDPAVDRLQLMKTSPNQSAAGIFARASWISILESRLFYETYLLNQSIRGVMDFRYDSEGMQKYGELLKGQISSIRKEVVTEYEEDPQIEVLLRKKGGVTPDDRKNYDSVVHDYIDGLRQTQLAILSDKNTEFYQIYESGYRVLALDELEKRLTGNSAIDSRDELRSRVDSPDFIDLVVGER